MLQYVGHRHYIGGAGRVLEARMFGRKPNVPVEQPNVAPPTVDNEALAKETWGHYTKGFDKNPEWGAEEAQQVAWRKLREMFGLQPKGDDVDSPKLPKEAMRSLRWRFATTCYLHGLSDLPGQQQPGYARAARDVAQYRDRLARYQETAA